VISRVGIISNNKKAEAIEASRFIKTELNRIGVDVWIEDSQCGLELLDFLVILGGDGTVLHSFQKYGELEIPFLCINFGSVGFLSSISPHELAEYWSCIVNGLYRIEERSVLNIAILRKNQNLEYYYALNDLVIRSIAFIFPGRSCGLTGEILTNMGEMVLLLPRQLDPQGILYQPAVLLLNQY